MNENNFTQSTVLIINNIVNLNYLLSDISSTTIYGGYESEVDTPFYSQELEVQMQKLYNRLPEKNRRLYAGIEALKLPYDGVSYIARLFNCARDTVLLGIQELNEDELLPQNRNRKEGGGRTAILDQDSNIDAVFLLLLKEHMQVTPWMKQ